MARLHSVFGTRLSFNGRIQRWQAVVIAVFGLALYLLALSSAAFRFDGSATYQLDFDVYRQGATAWVSGQPLYEHPFSVSGIKVAMPFTYPPVAAIALVPTTWFDYRTASIVWMGLTSVALVLSLFFVARSVGWNRSLSLCAAFLAGAIAIWTIPVRANLAIGQINVFLMALVLVDALARRPPWPRGMLIGVAAAIKLTPAGFVLFFLLRRDYRAAAVAAVTALGLNALAALISPEDSRAFWLNLGDQANRIQVFDAVANLSLRGLAERLPGPPSASVLLWLTLSALVVAIGVVAMRRHVSNGENGVALLVNAIVILLVSPVSWDHHWVWIVPLLLLFVPSIVRGSAMVLVVMLGTVVIFLVDQVAYEPLRGGWLLWLAWGISMVAWLSRDTLHSARDASAREVQRT